MTQTVQPSNYGPILPLTEAKGDDVCAAAAAAGHEIIRVYGYNSTPDHNNLKCIDFMNYGDVAMRDWTVGYLIANKERLGVAGLISNHHVMGFPSQGTAYRGPEAGWRDYTGPNPHTDHVHVEFNTNPIGASQPHPGVPAPTVHPVPTPRPVVSVSALLAAEHHDAPAAGRPVSYDKTIIVERALLAEGLEQRQYVDGSAGTTFITAYKAWQERCGYHGAAADGYVGVASLTRLGARHGFTVAP